MLQHLQHWLDLFIQNNKKEQKRTEHTKNTK